MEIKFYPKVITHDLPSLDTATRKRIRHALQQKLKVDPFIYGLPLRAPLKNIWKLRVGDWRVLYTINGNIIEIIAIGPRRKVYNTILKRI